MDDDLTSSTTSSFLDQPIPDLVLLHHLNATLLNARLPTIRNIRDATPSLLIALYEARGNRVPYVVRGSEGEALRERVKNLKLLVGCLVCDDSVGTRQRESLAGLDLRGFCEKKVDAVREVLGTVVEVLGDARPDRDTARRKDERSRRYEVSGDAITDRDTARRKDEQYEFRDYELDDVRWTRLQGEMSARYAEDEEYEGDDSEYTDTMRESPTEELGVTTDFTTLLRPPPSPPSQGRYLKLPGQPKSLTTLSPVRKSQGSQMLGKADDDDDGTSSVLASLNEGQARTGAHGQDRAEALRRLRDAEKWFRSGSPEKMENRTLYEQQSYDATDGISRASEDTEISYKDIEDRLDIAEQDGTVDVGKLEELVKRFFVEKGYQVVDEES